AARVLKDAPEYARQFDPVRHVPLGQGGDRYEDRPELAKITLADYAERARRMWRNRLRWMARQGLWAEDMIYRLSNVEGTYNLAYHADDPVIRKRAEMILDLHWLLYALQTVDGQFGGAQNRFKPHYAGYHPERGTGWYYFGGRPGTQPCTAALLGDYLPPEIAYRLLEQPDKRGCFVYREPLFASKTPSAPQANGSRTPSSAKLGPLGAVMLPTAAALATLALLGATSAGPTSDPIRAQALTRAPAPTEGKPRACVGAYYFDGWAGTHPKDGKADWARNAPTHLTERLATEFADREPLWGWRDDTLPIMERQIDLAADHGLAFFAFCWYWHETEKAVRDDPKHTGLRLFLNASNNGRMRFCLLVANHAGFEIQGETAWRRATALWMPYLTHPRSLRVGGKPLLIVFNPAGGDKAGLDYLQQAARKAGLPGVAVAGVGQAPRDMGYTHTTYYSVVPGWEKGLEAHKYREFVEAHKASWRGRPDQPHIPCLSVGWDRRPWEPADPARGRCCWYYPDRTPEEFAAGLRDAVEWIERHPDQVTPKKLMVLYAWNEYGEGGYLVPTRGDPEGAYLKALRSVLLP
ncbi:MAG: glycoside hydrolase family 99-like domain-containing protein, partial [Phycisphaerae bacterium]